jgi:hypothetical protein
MTNSTSSTTTTIIPPTLRVPLLRSALATWVCIWSTARVDSALLLLTWILVGSFTAGAWRNVWIQHPIGGVLVDLAQDLSFILCDTLGPLQTPVTFLIALAALGGLVQQQQQQPHQQQQQQQSQSNNNNTTVNGNVDGNSTTSMNTNKKPYKKPLQAKKAAWIFFALSRILLPISLISSTDDILSFIGYITLTGLSFIGPLSSWPARCFVFADAVYSLTTTNNPNYTYQQQFSNNNNNILSAGTEAAVVAACLCWAHDAAAKYFMYFLEQAAFTIGLVFIAESTIVVFHQPGFTTATTSNQQSSNQIFSTNWEESFDVWSSVDTWTWLTTKAPPMVLTLWALGMHFRTLTQGRVNAVEFTMCTLLALACGSFVLVESASPSLLVTRPIFASVVCVAAMFFSSRIAEGRRSILGRNRWFVATGAFRAFPTRTLSSMYDNNGFMALYMNDDDDLYGNNNYMGGSSYENYGNNNNNEGQNNVPMMRAGSNRQINTNLNNSSTAATSGNMNTNPSSSSSNNNNGIMMFDGDNEGNGTHTTSPNTTNSNEPPPTLDELRNQLQETIHLADLWRQNLFRLNAVCYGVNTAEEKTRAQASVDKAIQTIKDLDELAAKRQLEIVRLMSIQAGNEGSNSGRV